MSRNLDSSLAAALANSAISPVILAMLTFKSGVVYVWSGVGLLSFNSNVYTGVGIFGKISPVSEGSDIKADGMELTLSGIGMTSLTESSSTVAANMVTEAMSDYQIGAPAKVWFGLMSGGILLGSPYLIFSGQMDQPTIDIEATTATVTLALENKLSNQLRPTARRYTSADQHLKYPDDIGFNWVNFWPLCIAIYKANHANSVNLSARRQCRAKPRKRKV